MIYLPIPKPFVQIADFKVGKFLFIVGRHIDEQMAAQLKCFLFVNSRLVGQFSIGSIKNDEFTLMVKGK